ncbi:MAG TPA: hypothetical protein VFM68_03510 [Candidatus Saccharimonadales bacterium]|nr:hypothetical protein [Candidatus Saccharimonadales bacterium]
MVILNALEVTALIIMISTVPAMVIVGSSVKTIRAMALSLGIVVVLAFGSLEFVEGSGLLHSFMTGLIGGGFFLVIAVCGSLNAFSNVAAAPILMGLFLIMYPMAVSSPNVLVYTAGGISLVALLAPLVCTAIRKSSQQSRSTQSI